MKRPISVTILSICNIVFGVVGLMSACMTMLSLAAVTMPAPPGHDPDNPLALLLRDHAAYRAITAVLSLLGVFTSVLLAISGVGMLVRQAWARWMAIVWAGLRLLRIAVEVGVTIVIVTEPVANHSVQTGGQSTDPAMLNVAMRGCCGCSGVVLAIYPIAAMVVLLTSAATRWFAGDEETPQVEPWNA